jgi:S-adenosylmethionine:tRNA ribosyltransferase-isomerase
MRVDDFDFYLPNECIAAAPASPRDTARLLHVTASALLDRGISDLPALLAPGDALVLNDTRVIPARLHGMRGAAKVEILLHKSRGSGYWQAFAKPARRLRVGDEIVFADSTARVEEKLPSGEVVLAFGGTEEAFFEFLNQHGTMPLPPYIPRPSGAVDADRTAYQTCFAARAGAVAAPTAGLHFTPELLEEIRRGGVAVETVTLHVGAGTFLPVKVEDTREHRMHSEWGEITPEAAARLNTVRAAGGRVVAVGTTSLRLLESAADAAGTLHPFCGETEIFTWLCS